MKRVVKKRTKWLFHFATAVAYLCTVGLLWRYGKSALDSDTASEMVLANYQNATGDAVLSSGWWYSTELRVFYLQPVYRLMLLFFPNDWYTAHVLGQAVWILFLIFAWRFLTKEMQLGGISYLIGVLALVLPIGGQSLLFALYGGFYLPQMVLLCVTLALFIRFQRMEGGGITLLLLCGVSLVNGLTGFKMIMGLHIPLFIGSGLTFMFSSGCSEDTSLSKFRRLALVLAPLAFALMGMLLYFQVLMKAYDCYDFTGLTYTRFSIGGLLQSIADFPTLLGYPSPKGNLHVDVYLGGSLKVLSLFGVLASFGVLLPALFVAVFVMLLRRYKGLSSERRCMVATFIGITLIQGFIMSNTSGGLNAARYWLVPYPMLLLTLGIGLENGVLACGRKIYRAVSCLCCICIVSCSLSVALSWRAEIISISDSSGLNSKERIANWLVTNGYKKGYATFWNGNVLTELSNGELDLWVVEDQFGDFSPRKWLQIKSHDASPQGRVFLLTTEQELGQNGISRDSVDDHFVHQDGEYLIYSFESFSELKEIVVPQNEIDVL